MREAIDSTLFIKIDLISCRHKKTYSLVANFPQVNFYFYIFTLSWNSNRTHPLKKKSESSVRIFGFLWKSLDFTIFGNLDSILFLLEIKFTFCNFLRHSLDVTLSGYSILSPFLQNGDKVLIPQVSAVCRKAYILGFMETKNSFFFCKKTDPLFFGSLCGKA